MKAGERLARLGAELTVIVLGVLIAFQVDSWNERRIEREREHEYLAALRAEFSENATRLERSLRTQREVTAAAGRLIRISEGLEPIPDAAEMAQVVVNANRFSRFEKVSGAYDALVSSGDVGLLQNDSLRAELAAFSGAAGSEYEDERMADLLHVEGMQAISRLIPMWQVLPERYSEALELSPDVELIDFGPLLGDEPFMGLMASIAILEVNHITYYEGLLRRVRRIDALLSEALE